MPERDDMEPDTQLSGAATNMISRIEVKLAGLDARSTSEIAALKRDTEIIRTMHHDLNGSLQNIVALVVAGQNTLGGHQATLSAHMAQCDKRGARLEKICFLVVGLLLTVLGFLLQRDYFTLR